MSIVACLQEVQACIFRDSVTRIHVFVYSRSSESKNLSILEFNKCNIVYNYRETKYYTLKILLLYNIIITKRFIYINML